MMIFREKGQDMSSSNCSGGFSLIELMITVVIVSIIAAVAYPSYTSYIVKSNRAVAKGFMLTVANREEQYVADARSYGVVTSDAEFTSVLNLPIPTDVSNFYDVRVAYVGGNTRTYMITATPISTKMNASDGTLTLDNLGAKLPATKW